MNAALPSVTDQPSLTNQKEGYNTRKRMRSTNCHHCYTHLPWGVIYSAKIRIVKYCFGGGAFHGLEGVPFLNWRGCLSWIGGGAFPELEGVLFMNWRGCFPKLEGVLSWIGGRAFPELEGVFFFLFVCFVLFCFFLTWGLNWSTFVLYGQV